MAKKKRSWKKKLGKALMAGAALAGGLALARKRATDAPGDAMAAAKQAMTTDRAYTGTGYDDPIMTGGVGVKPSRPRVDTSWMSKISPGLAYGQQIFKKGGRVRGAGKAKRGLGRAFSKGRK